MKIFTILILILLLFNGCATNKQLIGTGLVLTGVYLITNQTDSKHIYETSEIRTNTSGFNNGYANRSWLTTESTSGYNIQTKDNNILLGTILTISGLFIAF